MHQTHRFDSFPRSQTPSAMSFRLLILLVVGLVTGLSRTLAAEPTPYHGTPHLTSTRIEAEHFDHGGQGVAYRGLGAVVTNTAYHENEGSWFKNTYPPIPRERSDADIGVGIRMQNGVTNTYLALRPGEWTLYSFAVPTNGYYSMLFKLRGPEAYDQGIGRCEPGEGLYTQGKFQIELDGITLASLDDFQTNMVKPRVWLSAGQHRLKLVATEVFDAALAYAQACDYGGYPPGEWDYTFPSWARIWPFHTLLVDWLQVEPSPAPLRADLLAGGTMGFADGAGQAAQFSWITIVGEVPSGELVIYDRNDSDSAFRLVSRGGQVRTWAGHPGNPPRGGHGTNAGFGPVRHTLVKPDGTLLVLHQENYTNTLISAVVPSGEVTVLYQGFPVVPAAQRDISPANPRDDLPVTLARLLFDDDGAVLAETGYTESFWFSTGKRTFYITYQKLARFGLTPTGELALLSVNNDSSVRPTFRDLGEGYRLDRPEDSSPVYFVDEDGFTERVHTWVSSAYRAADGTLWGAGSHQVFQLIPDPSIRYALIRPSPDGTVEGPLERGVSEHDEQFLQAVPTRPFRVFSHWSDGNSENPRLLHLSRDTTLTPHFVIRLPEVHGIAPRSLRILPNGLVELDLIGPERLTPGEFGYVYNVEYSNDLRRWFRLDTITGTIADKPVTTIRSSTATTTPRRYYRARLVIE